MHHTSGWTELCITNKATTTRTAAAQQRQNGVRCPSKPICWQRKSARCCSYLPQPLNSLPITAQSFAGTVSASSAA
eukprot:1151267-Pelagomonas_calceolata.AAC.2